MKKKLFMIIAIMIIVTMAVVGLAACIDNNGGGNNGGSDNGDNNNGSGNIDNNGGNTDNGGGVEEVTPITETAGININNFRNELGKRKLTMSSNLKFIENKKVSTLETLLEYEPTKSKETKSEDGKSIVNYVYSVDNKKILIDNDFNLNIIDEMEELHIATDYIAYNAGDLFELKEGKYCIKTVKYEEYFKKLYNVDALPDATMWEIFKLTFASIRIEFKSDSIIIDYGYNIGDNGSQFNCVITKIDNTNVVIPQEILDMPIHGVKINNTNSLYVMNYTATLKEEVNGVATESELKFCNDNNKPRLAFYVKGEADIKVYVWEEIINGQTEYFIATRENGEIIKEYAFRDDLYVIVDMLNGIVGTGEYFELKEGKYVVKEDSIEDYINSYNLNDIFSGDLDAARAYVSSIEYYIGKDTITLSYEKTEYSETTKTTLTINDFHTTTTSIPNSIKNLPITIA